MIEVLDGLIHPEEVAVLQKHGISCGSPLTDGKGGGFVPCPAWVADLSVLLGPEDPVPDLLDQVLLNIEKIPGAIDAVRTICATPDDRWGDLSRLNGYLKEIGALS